MQLQELAALKADIDKALPMSPPGASRISTPRAYRAGRRLLAAAVSV